MGNCATSGDGYDPTVTLTKSHFNLICCIGKGGFGKVWRVQHRSSKQIFAMKEMHKGRVINKRSVSSVMNERKLLAVLKHPFIVNMQYAFQDHDNLFLVMDLMPGGDLRFHIGRMKAFSEDQTKFFVSCVLTGLEYLHLNNVIHRDIKPENLVLDCKGYVRITDFGIARVTKSDNSYDTSGTPGYMAPEVMCKQSHGIAVDYFALGVLVYEFMMGRRPYNGRSRKEIRDAVVARQVQLRKTDIPDGWSVEAADFVNKLLWRKASNRLGFNGPHEVKNHAWLRDVQWQKIFEKTVDSPFKPETGDNFDYRIALQEWKDEDELDSSQLQDTSVQELFDGYFFDVNRVQMAKPREEATTVALGLRPRLDLSPRHI